MTTIETSRPPGSATSTALAIDVRELVKTYPNDVRALDGLSFSVPAGTIFGLLGPNGAGKSTAVKILTTLARPDSGEATVAGIDVLRESAAVRRAIGAVSQKASFDREATGRENLRLQGQLYGMRGSELEARIDELLERMRLADVGDRLARTYSGGMQRRLDIAIGLVHRPEVLFLDEPTTGLDPEVRAEMWNEITRLQRDDGLTILLTTHYLEEADELASSLAIVDRGRVVAAGSPEQLKGQLHGDAVQVELGSAVEEALAREALSGLDQVRELAIDERVLRARVSNGATALPTILAALDGARVPVSSVTVSRPSLDDVYLRHAGRGFAEAEAEAGKKQKEERR